MRKTFTSLLLASLLVLPVHASSSRLAPSELADLAARQASGNPRLAAAVKTLEGAGFFGHFAEGLARNAEQQLEPSLVHRVAAGSLTTRNAAARDAFATLTKAGFFKGAMRNALLSRPSTDWKETMLEGELQLFTKALLATQSLQRQSASKQDGKLRRTFHAKQVMGAAAELRVLPDLPDYARHGLFGQPASYRAWVRFSKGDPMLRADQRPDQHGIALKVLAPGGEQDFILANNPSFFMRDARQFLAIIGILTGEGRLYDTLVKQVGVKEAARIAGLLKRHAVPLRSSAKQTYWSGLPMRLGPYAIKLKLQPAAGNPEPKGFFTSTNYLREDLEARLAAGPLRFDLMAQFYVDPQRTPIEDGTIEWKESDAPFMKVAELVVGARQPGSQQASEHESAVDRMSFSPWHGSDDMRPLGNIMRLRRLAYEASARLRGASATRPNNPSH